MKCIMKYRLPKGSEIRRYWTVAPADATAARHEEFVTTKDAYYSNEDIEGRDYTVYGKVMYLIYIPESNGFNRIRVGRDDLHCVEDKEVAFREIMGFTGKAFLDTGYVYAPYRPLVFNEIQTP